MTVKPGPPQPPKIRRIGPRSTVEVRRRGQARLLLAREAECFLLARGKQATLKTRTPTDDSLFQQGRGESICFISGKRKLFVKGQAPSARTTSAVKFAAIVETGESNEPVQVRIRYRPKSSVGIAVRRGEASVSLSTGRELDLGGGSEMRADLTKRNTIKPGTLRVGQAHFDSVEEGFWERGARSWLPLSVETAGSGSGTVVSSPVGIDCGDDCDESYAVGTVVTLRATPFSGSEFLGWSDGCTGTKSRCTVTMNEAKFVTAVFTQPGRLMRLTVSKAGSGTVTSNPAGIDCGSICEWQYKAGTPVTLSASAAGGSYFAGWGGSCSGMECSVTMDAARSVTANFSPTLVPTFRLSVDKAGSGTGRVTSSSGGIDCGSTCAAQYTRGERIAVTAFPDAGSRFEGWNGYCMTPVNPCWVTMDAAASLTATFIQQFQLTVTNNAPGVVVTSDAGGINCGYVCVWSYDLGTPVTLTASSPYDSGYPVWSGDCSGTDPCSLTMDAPKNVTVELSPGFTDSFLPAAPGP